ncbi:hypothetical protein BH10PSE11_BH10PSE11_01570 [soil metagenome]
MYPNIPDCRHDPLIQGDQLGPPLMLTGSR